MKPDVLLICPLIRHVMETLDKDYTLYRLYEAADPDRLLTEIGDRVRAVATGGHVGCSASVMKALPSLEIIAGYGVGVDAVDLALAARRGVIVTNTPDVLNDDVANLAVALVLATSRALVAGDRYVRDGRWREANMPLARSIRGKRMGVLGLGRIGKDIARKLQVFGCEIGYHGRRAQPDQPYRFYGDLAEMAADSDYVIVICPGGTETRHLVDRAVLDALGPEGTLINVARGSVVDEAALVADLLDGRLGAAGLDVFEDEPNVPEALLGLDSVVLQPHRGSATVETRTAMGDLMLRNLEAHFAGQPVPTPVTV